MSTTRFSDVVTRVAISLPFRVVLSVAILGFHLVAMARVARDRFDWPFMFNAPEPTLGSLHDPAPRDWQRLIVSRWDAQHYEALGLRGYTTCKDKSELASGEVPDDDGSCELDFYPTYGMIGGVVRRITHLPIDYCLFGVSLVASFAFLMMWTGRTMVDGLGVANTYLSLLLLNLFSTGYTLVTVQTEPCVMALTLGSFLCLRRRWLVLGAVLAGAATSIRVSGVATGFAYCGGLLVLTLAAEPRPTWRWVKPAILMAVSGWGILFLMGYYQHRWGDPLIYAHAHERAFHHRAGITKIFFPDGKLLMQSIWAEPNDGLILASALLWFALGHQKGLAGFHAEERAYWYVLFFGIIGICMIGSVDYAYGGNSRYMVSVLPIFFAMAALMRRRPVLLALWLFMSTAHYYNGNVCFYLGQIHSERLQRCGFARYFQ